MSFTRAVAHNTAVQLVGKVVSTALGLVALALLARYLGLERYGWYATATGWLQFVGIICDFGFTVTISNMLAEPKFGKRAVLNTVFTWRLITAFVIHGLAPFIFLFFPYPAPVKLAVFILSLSFFATALNNVFIGWYRTALSMQLPTASEVFGRVILVVGLLLVAKTNAGFIAAMGMVCVAAIVPNLYLYQKIGGIRLSLDRAVSRDLWRKMWPTATAVIFNAIYLQGDRVLLPLYAPQTTVGLYGFSYRVLDVALQVAAMVMGLVMPTITFAWARGLHREFSERFQLALNMLALLLFPISAGIFALATPILHFVAGSDFAAGGAILRGLSISIFGTCFGMVFGHVALALDKQKQALWVYVSDAILSIIGYLIFIPRFGVWGAIGVTIFSEFYAGILLMALTIYHARQWPRFTVVGKIALASIVMALGVALAPLPHVLWSVAWGAALYATLILAFRIVPLSSLRELLRKPIVETPTV
jgi:O-antigen/teichoic acid export membrane protein